LFYSALGSHKQKSQRHTVPIYGAVNGQEDVLAHLLTRVADVAVARAAPRPARSRRKLFLLIVKGATPLAVQPVRNALVIASHLGGRGKGTRTVATDVFKFPKKFFVILFFFKSASKENR
jgi:hypothetical protein